MKKALTLLALLLIALVFPAHAESTEPVQWQGHTLTPVYGMIYPNTRYRVRLSCDEVPLTLLWEHMDDFRLSLADGATVYSPCDIVIMEYYLKGVEEDVTTEFFDLCFEYKGNPDFSGASLHFGEDGPARTFPDGKSDPSACAFETRSGAFVVNLTSEQAADALAGMCANRFNGRDITLYLDSIQVLTDYYACQWIRQFEFASLDLRTTLKMGVNFDADILTSLTLMKNPGNLPVMPNVKTLTCRVWGYLPERMNETFPNLETLCLLLDIPFPGREDSVLSQNYRPANISESLQVLEIMASYGSILTEDSDFRIWLAAQRIATPKLTINGAPAADYDLADGLSRDELAEMTRIETDAQLMYLYHTALAREVAGSAAANRVIVLVVGKYGDILCVSTDAESEYDFSVIPPERLAPSLAEADTLAVVYPDMTVVGKYSGTFDACSVDTRIALIDLETSVRTLDESIVVRQPPQSVTLGSGENSGTFEVRMGLDALAERLRQHS